VGCNPAAFGVAPERFHAEMQAAIEAGDASLWPNATHDSKRGELVRQRIAVLSELAPEWGKLVADLTPLLDRHRQQVSSGSGPAALAPSRDEIYFLLQTLVGCLPDVPGDRRSDRFRSRVQAYMDKAIKEAKVNTRWTQSNQAWESAMREYVGRLLSDPQFLSRVPGKPSAFEAFQERVARAAETNFMAERSIRAVAAVTHDTYQGWLPGAHLKLVDPDNRAVPDFAALGQGLAALELARRLAGSDLGLVRGLRQNGDFNTLALYLQQKDLHFRRDHAAIVKSRSYEPLHATRHEEHIIACRRRAGEQSAIAVAPRTAARMFAAQAEGGKPWAGGWLVLPADLQGRKLRDIYTGQVFEAQKIPGKNGGEPRYGIQLSRLFKELPSAVLVTE